MRIPIKTERYLLYFKPVKCLKYNATKEICHLKEGECPTFDKIRNYVFMLIHFKCIKRFFDFAKA